jgi:hypothetical protein
MVKIITNRYLLLAILFLHVFFTNSCEKKRPGVDYHFSDEHKGWLFIIYESPEYPALPIENGRIQVVFPPGENVIYTASSPAIGWAEDRYYLNEKKVSSDELGGLTPWRVNCWKKVGGNYVLRYDEFFLGDSEEIGNYDSPDVILNRIISK